MPPSGQVPEGGVFVFRQTNKAVPLSNPNTRLAPRPSIINTDDPSLFMAARHTGQWQNTTYYSQ